jgi:DNA-binding SARP family transcriptional activator/tetratricopeptide (TPR) repeat protein/TolB-like protein
MLRLQTLGQLRFIGEGTTTLSSRRKELVLLAYLARRSPRPLGRAEAAALLWQERDEHRARQSLRQALLELRRLVGAGLIVEPERLWLADQAVELDATVFDQEVAAGKFEDAVARWHGDFLYGAEEVGGEELRGWLEPEREALRQRLRHALLQLVVAARSRGAWAEGIGWAERWIAALPLDQEAHIHLLRLLHLDGRTADALSRYAAFSVQLRAADLEPSPEFTQLGTHFVRDPASPSHPRPNSTALFTPSLVGRGPALAELVTAWRLVQRGGCSVVSVEGELGIGKTRLGEEFLRWLESDGKAGYHVHCREGAGPPEFSVIAQIGSRLATAPGLAGTPSSALSQLSTIVPQIRARFPSLPDPKLDPAQVADAVREVAAAVAEESALVLFIDDLGQADNASRRVLLSLIERLPPRTLVVVTVRTGGDDAALSLPSHPHIRRLKLQPLTIAEVELLLASILELPSEDRRHLASQLHAHAGGNPFYIVELVSALADEGTLALTERGEWRLNARESRLPLPDSVRDVVSRRVARLTPPGCSALEAAAVLAIPFDRELLEEVGGLSPSTVDDAIEELLLHHLIRKTGNSGTFEFAHELVRHHVDRSVTAGRGEELSSRAISALKARAPGDPIIQIALANHRKRASAITAAAGRRRTTSMVLVAAAAVLVMVVAALAALRTHPMAPNSREAIAVLPFSVSGAPELGYLGDGIVTLLSTELDGVGALRIADPRAVIGLASQIGKGAPDVERGSRVAERVGADTYVIGDIVEGGGRVRIGAAVYHRSNPSRPIARATVEGSTGQLFEMVDGLAGRLLSGLNPGPYEQLTRVAATTTSSLPALKSYLEGERLFRGGAFHPAARAFQRAINEDTTFALAYYWLSVASWWADDSKAIDSAASRAVQFGSRLSQRDRRLFQAWDAFLRGDATEAERIYRQIVGLEPDNVEAWLQLGEVLFHSGPRRGYAMAAARQPFEQVLFFEPEHTSALLHLARIAASEGHTAELDSLARRILVLNQEGEWAVEARALRSFAEGDQNEQRQVVQELRTANEGRVWNIARYVAVGAQNLNGAEQLIELLTESTRPAEVRAYGNLALAHLQLARGRLRAADTALQRASLLDRVPALDHRALLAVLPFLPARGEQLRRLRDSIIAPIPSAAPVSLESSHLANLHDGVHQEIGQYLAASLSLRMGDLAAARGYMQQLQQPRHTPAAATVAHDAAESIRAQLAQATGQPAEAIKALVEVHRLEARVGLIGGSPFYSQGLERYLFAELLEKQGRTEEALRWYGSFSSNSVFDFVYLAPSEIRMGRLLEHLGRRKAAAEHYGRALALYAGSDPEFKSLVQEAEAGLARVTAGSS